MGLVSPGGFGLDQARRGARLVLFDLNQRLRDAQHNMLRVVIEKLRALLREKMLAEVCSTDPTDVVAEIEPEAKPNKSVAVDPPASLAEMQYGEIVFPKRREPQQ